MEFSKETRRLAIEKMQDRQLDLLIIGGGITGAGVALQAAASGMETGLIEMQDFAEDHGVMRFVTLVERAQESYKCVRQRVFTLL